MYDPYSTRSVAHWIYAPHLCKNDLDLESKGRTLAFLNSTAAGIFLWSMFFGNQSDSYLRLRDLVFDSDLETSVSALLDPTRTGDEGACSNKYLQRPEGAVPALRNLDR